MLTKKKLKSFFRNALFPALFVLVAATVLIGFHVNRDSLDCVEPTVNVNGVCCIDADADNMCDDICGDGNCTAMENCSNCWKDCGACKKIIYRYVPRNYTLGELTDDLRIVYDSDIKFKKDVYSSDETSNFFFFESKVPRTFGFFLSIDYRLLWNSRDLLLSQVLNENYYMNSTADLIKYLNLTRWYHTHGFVSSDNERYNLRITSGDATENYPAPPTGYKKEQKYKDWKFENYTFHEDIIFNNITEIEDGIVEAVYVSTWDYLIRYKTGEYEIEPAGEFTQREYLEQFEDVEELGLNYVHTMNIVCSDNLMISLYEYDYEDDKFSMSTLRRSMDNNREELLIDAKNIKSLCERKYGDERFSY